MPSRSVYAFVPARGGSKRIPDKNLRCVGRDSLVFEAALAAVEVAGDASTVVSTDDDKIASAVEGLGVQVHRRPSPLAHEHAQLEDVVAHWAKRQLLRDDDVIVLLQPTSPFRRTRSVHACIDAILYGEADTALTVTRNSRGPFMGRSFTSDGRSLWERPRAWKRPRSQDVRWRPEEAGSCYAFTWGHLKRTGQRMCRRPAVVVVDRYEAIEIDTHEDLQLARAILPHVDRLRALADAEEDGRAANG